MDIYKIELKLVRSFSIGFTVYSPKLNGFAFEIRIFCFSLMFRNKGNKFITFFNYWKYYNNLHKKIKIEGGK